MKMNKSGLIPDLIAGASFWPAWVSNAWFDVVLRYRRTLLGPFWMVITTGVLIACLSLIAPALFGGGSTKMVPYLATGIITWNFITLSISDLSGTFIERAHDIQSVRVPFSIYVYRVILRNLIGYGHLMLIYVFVAVHYQIWALPYLPVFLLGLALVLLNFVWIGFVLGILCVRYRDVRQVVAVSITIGFVLTPVFWDKSALLGPRSLVVLLNPLAHMLEVLRHPLLGEMPSAESVEFLTILLFVGGGIALFLYRKNINRLASWL